MIRSIAAILVAVVCACANAQTPVPGRIRGTLEGVDGNLLTVKTRNGELMKVKVPDNVLVVGIAKASIADIHSGKFIGTTTVGERDGALVALADRGRADELAAVDVGDAGLGDADN